MSEKYKKICKYLVYAEHVLNLVLTVTVGVSISAFASLVIRKFFIRCYDFCRRNNNLCNELGKAYFVHDAACSDSKDLPKTTISNKILKDRADEIARNRNMVGIEEL